MLHPVLTWVLVLLAVVCAAAWRWSLRRLEKMAEHLPGPHPLPLVGNALELGTSTTDFYKAVERLCKQYGSLFRLWMGPKLYIIMLDPADLEIVLSNSQNNNKGMVYNFLHPWLGTGLLTSTGEKWHKHRKLITPTFHFQILEQFLDGFNGNGNVLIEKLRKVADGPSFDINSYVTLYALDVITDTAMGLQVNAQTDSTSPYVKATRETSELVMLRMMKPWFYPDFVFYMTAYGRTQNKTIEILHNTTNNVIQERKKALSNVQNTSSERNANYSTLGKKRRVAFLDLLLQENLKSNALSDTELREEVDTFMFEGHDTTSSALGFILWLLSIHEDVQGKVYDEVAVLLSTNNKTPTITVLNEMKYLECVIKEGLRLYPSVPIMAREIKNDIPITRGVVLPANSTLVFPIFMIHKDPNTWPDPETFNPDRFMLDNMRRQHPFAYIPFSAGPRNCIGQKFAMLELKATISKVLMHYKLLPDKDFKPILSTELILKSENGIKLKIASRKD